MKKKQFFDCFHCLELIYQHRIKEAVVIFFFLSILNEQQNLIERITKDSLCGQANNRYYNELITGKLATNFDENQKKCFFFG